MNPCIRAAREPGLFLRLCQCCPAWLNTRWQVHRLPLLQMANLSVCTLQSFRAYCDIGFNNMTTKTFKMLNNMLNKLKCQLTVRQEPPGNLSVWQHWYSFKLEANLLFSLLAPCELIPVPTAQRWAFLASFPKSQITLVFWAGVSAAKLSNQVNLTPLTEENNDIKMWALLKLQKNTRTLFPPLSSHTLTAQCSVSR